MRFLSFAYRFITNFAFLATVYLSLGYIEKYNNRAILAIAHATPSWQAIEAAWYPTGVRGAARNQTMLAKIPSSP